MHECECKHYNSWHDRKKRSFYWLPWWFFHFFQKLFFYSLFCCSYFLSSFSGSSVFVSCFFVRLWNIYSVRTYLRRLFIYARDHMCFSEIANVNAPNIRIKWCSFFFQSSHREPIQSDCAFASLLKYNFPVDVFKYSIVLMCVSDVTTNFDAS